MNRQTIWGTIGVIVLLGAGTLGWFSAEALQPPGRAGGSRGQAERPARAERAEGTADEVTVQNARELEAALASGGTVRLAPGTYEGNFKIAVPNTTLRGVNPTGRRVAPADVSAVTLTPADGTRSTLSITASHVRVEGVYIASGAPDRECVTIGSAKATSAAAQPDDVTLDSVAIVAGPKGGHRGVSAHGSHITLIRSHVANFWEVGRDSQAFFGNNGPGPYRIEDNYLEASGENIMFGGASVPIKNLVPSDITIKDNDIVKPIEWRTAHRGSVKNSVEFKNARSVLLENNRIDGNWKDAQAGSTIVLTPRNQYGDCPWCVVDDVTIRGNVVTNTPDGYVVNILGTDNNRPSGQVRRVVIERNLFRDARSGVLVTGGVSDALIIRRNTFPSIRHNVIAFGGTDQSRKPKVVTPLTLEGNVFSSGQFGISGPTTPVGVPTLEVWASPYSVKGNVIERSKKRQISWPSGNKLVGPGSLATLLDATTFKYPGGEAGY